MAGRAPGGLGNDVELLIANALVFDGRAQLNTEAQGVHGVWVNGRMVADHIGLLPQAPLAGCSPSESG